MNKLTKQVQRVARSLNAGTLAECREANTFAREASEDLSIDRGERAIWKDLYKLIHGT